MFDAVEIEKRGIPTVTIAHDTFETAAGLHAKVMGLPELPLIVEPAPESGVVGDDIEGVAEETIKVLLDALLADEPEEAEE